MLKLLLTVLAASAAHAAPAHEPFDLGARAASSNSSSSSSSNSNSSSAFSTCRFAPLYNQSAILANPAPFIRDIMYWEGHFHSESVGINPDNGMTYDGILLQASGESNTSTLHQFSAASKESLQVMLYVHALAGDELAGVFLSPTNSSGGADVAANMLRKKLDTYTAFNRTFPGFGGWLPWFYSNETALRPTYDWVNRVPALDNGELVWAIYAAVEVMRQSGREDWQDLADGWQAWLDYVASTASTIFYHGEGRVCSVIDLNQTLPWNAQTNLTCEGGLTALLNDPYEGELFVFFLYLYGNLSSTDKSAILDVKSPQLVAVNFTGSNVPDSAYNDTTAQNYTGAVAGKAIGPITTQKGFWFSAHEQWKLLEMPYTDIPLVKRVFHNAERIRTCNSVLMGRNAGMFASINNVTVDGVIQGYISYAGIPAIANQSLQELDVITPYGVFPTVLFNKTVGLAWYHNMLVAKAMQNPYGSTESTRRDGTAVSAFVSWDSKITTVNSILGGVTKWVRAKMKCEGVYDEWHAAVQGMYAEAFAGGVVGDDVDMCLPDYQVPDAGVTDFSSCS